MTDPWWEDDGVTVFHGDCIEVMRGLPADSVDAVVTDPPYELGFMGKTWDASGIAYNLDVWREALRVLKPGGHVLAFGGTRTWHRLAVAVEDAGFEIRDSIAWMYGSGFPKSLDVSKAIDKKRYARAEVLKVTKWIRDSRNAAGITNRDIDGAFGFRGMAGHWTSGMSQPSVPTLEQIPTLLRLLGMALDDVPSDVRDLIWTLNGRKGQPGRNWLKREVIGKYETDMGGLGGQRLGQSGGDISAPATPAAEKWQGWGTALKPAHEPIVVARKPLEGTVAENVLRWGTGALNIDGCRVAASAEDFAKLQAGVEAIRRRGGSMADSWKNSSDLSGANPAHPAGRWPANVILDETQAAELDKQSGTITSGAAVTKGSSGFADGYDGEHTIPYGDTGGASRFFYVPKANKQERPRDGDTAHPTVKPVDLMRYLVRLVTPPGGTVLDPFAGSGTTAQACIIEGFTIITIEKDETYLPLIRQRLTQPQALALPM